MRALLPPLLRTCNFGHLIFAAALASTFPSLSFAAEPASLPRVGVLLVNQQAQAELRAGLNARGYIEGTNIQVDWKITQEGYDKLQSLAAELVRAKVDILVAAGDAATRAAMQATSSIPLVFASGDPIVAGWAKTLSHPGTNATGVYVPQPELEAKRIELLMELSPRPRRITYVRNPDNPLSGPLAEFAKKAAITHRVQLAVLDVRQRSDIANALKRVNRSTTDAVLVAPDVVLLTHHIEIVRTLRSAQVPVIYPWRAYVDDGGLMYFGVSIKGIWRQVAYYIDRILKGARPSELPIEEVSNFELVLNQREASSLRIEFPQSLLARANETIR